MKILQILPHLSDGGAERLVVDLSNELVKQGASVTLCTLYREEELSVLASELDSGVELVQLDKKKGFDRSLFTKLSYVLSATKPKVVHTHLLAVNYVAPLSVLYPDISFYHTVHNDGFRETRRFAERAFRWTFYAVQRIKAVTISEASRDGFKAAYRAVEPIMIPNGRRFPERSESYGKVEAEVNAMRVTPQTKLFVNLARIVPQKNQVMLVEAFMELIKEGHDIALALIGGERGVEGEAMRRRIEEIRNERIHLLGSRRDATDFLYAADGFCLSSEYEGMPISLIEAFAVGCIPLCTPVGGIQNMIRHSYNGFLSRDVTKGAFKQALLEMLAEERLSEIRENCKRTFTESYDIRETARRYLELFEGKGRQRAVHQSR